MFIVSLRVANYGFWSNSVTYGVLDTGPYERFCFDGCEHRKHERQGGIRGVYFPGKFRKMKLLKTTFPAF